MKTIIANDRRTGKLRARVVDTGSIVREAATMAESGKSVILVRDGGSVCNNYGYPASTEGVVVVAVKHRDEVVAVVYASELAANKVTSSGVLAKAIGEFARPIKDQRYGAEETKKAWGRVVAEALADAGCWD